MRFKIGNKVQIKKRSIFYDQLKGYIGIITHIDSSRYPSRIKVDWNNDWTNKLYNHPEHMLELATIDYVKQLKEKYNAKI